MPTTTGERERPSVSDHSRSRIEPAPAKLNLALHVKGRGPGGYHLLDTLAVFASVGDVIRAEPAAGGLSTTVQGPFADELTAGLFGNHLVLRAATMLAELYPGDRPGTRLILDKRLPVSAGIGGGSADAAATFRLLDRIWGLGLGPARLVEPAATIGADVPMCLHSRPLRAEGIGEKLTMVDGLPALPVVLVNPLVPVSTKAVFDRLESAEDPPLPVIPRFRSVIELVLWLRQTRNGLDAPARAEARVITRVLAALRADPDCMMARMSGSGPTCFGIFASASGAERAAVRLRVAQPDWWIVAAQTGGS